MTEPKTKQQEKGSGATTLLSTEHLEAPAELFEEFVYGLALADRDRRLLYLNRKARELLLPGSGAEAARAGLLCCDLICSRLEPIIGGGCLSEWVASSGTAMPEIRMDIQAENLEASAWVTASWDGSRVLFHLRPGQPGDRRRRTPPGWASQTDPSQRPDLQISTLGRFQVEGGAGPINGEWLAQRPGQLLKYLICERRRFVTSDQIGETLWPEAAPQESGNRLRYNVHALREKLEPGRERRSPARFVVARRGGYAIDAGGVWLDADRFEVDALAGLGQSLVERGEAAALHLEGAMRLYRGEFLAGDPYLDWAIPERERLHELACRALRAQARIAVDLGRLEAAADHARRLADMEPFDSDTQRLLIEVCLRRGRHSEAHRRYSLFRKKLAQSFGREPDFELADVGLELAGDSPGVGKLD
jgi:DNA-binding SARP family transcriptional activator